MEQAMLLEMMKRQVDKILREATRKGHAGGVCWLHHEVNKDGYATTSIWQGTGKPRKKVIASRLVCVMKDLQPYASALVAGHDTPIMCCYRNCIRPEHLGMETSSEGAARREADARLTPAIALAKLTAMGLTPK
jgi:hypothetical protein